MLKECSTIELDIPRIRIVGSIVVSQRDLNSCWLFSTPIHLSMIDSFLRSALCNPVAILNPKDY
jgi:hypothetical protein